MMQMMMILETKKNNSQFCLKWIEYTQETIDDVLLAPHPFVNIDKHLKTIYPLLFLKPEPSTFVTPMHRTPPEG